MENKKIKLNVHLTNIHGLGAVQLIKSLLPALEKSDQIELVKIYIPAKGPLSNYLPSDQAIEVETYHRYLPNGISRFIECVFSPYRFACNDHILVLGDLPLKCSLKQTVFIQTSYLLKPLTFKLNINQLKFYLMRFVFRLNCRYVNSFIVQTEIMKDDLIRSYPTLAGRVYVVAQPAPKWLDSTKLSRVGRKVEQESLLTLIYPAAHYPHKNHSLLANLTQLDSHSLPIRQLILTIDKNINPAPKIPWITCVGELSPEQIVKSYSYTDGVLFLSKSESYGFPLVEAMRLGLPIICSDFPYARNLCGEVAIYFDSDDISSLKNAIQLLRKKLDGGWWPDWSLQLESIPKSWSDVAHDFFRVIECTHKNKIFE